jgi:hypothetical protein
MSERINRRQFLALAIITATGSVAGCQKEPKDYEDFAYIGDVWQITRIGKNKFIVDGINSVGSSLKENKEHAIQGVHFIQNNLDCRFKSIKDSPVATSDITIEVEDPTCITEGICSIKEPRSG